jgi:hypothetical protein
MEKLSSVYTAAKDEIEGKDKANKELKGKIREHELELEKIKK